MINDIVTHDTFKNVDEEHIKLVKEYQQDIENGDLYNAKRIYKTGGTSGLSDYIINASVINELDDMIVYYEDNILLKYSDWLYYDEDLPSRSAMGDCALK